MKKLEELGISPTPWKVVPYWDHSNGDPTHGDIEFADGTSAFVQDTSIGIPKISDANIFSAAPDLYDAAFKTEAVLEKLFTLDEFAALLKSGAADALIACREELRSALAKASGEGEV